MCLATRTISVCDFFFFQAEDGIRDLVRSRGLGDVYKRQVLPEVRGLQGPLACLTEARYGIIWGSLGAARSAPVSYTHLTLPTSDLV